MKAILALIVIGILVLVSLYLVTKNQIFEPFALTSLADVKTTLQTDNLSGKTFAKVYKNIAVNKGELSTFWKTLQDPSQSILMDDRLEMLRMISCLSFNHEQFANFPKFFRTTDYYTEYFETISNNFKDVKANLIAKKVKEFQSRVGKKVHGPLILLMFQAPRYTMTQGSMSIMNFNIGDYNFKAANKNEPVHMAFYLIAPLHNKNRTPNLSRTKADICCRLQWLKSKANTDNLCFVETPNDSIQSFGGCRNISNTSNWQCADNRVVRRNARGAFECLRTKNSNSCIVAATEAQCNSAIVNNATSLPINNREEVAYLNQIVPNVKYNTKCTGPGKGINTDKKLMDYGTAYYINADYPDFANLFDELAIYPFDETKLGQACPTSETTRLEKIRTFIASGQRMVDTEISITGIPNPPFPKINFTQPVIYTIAMWLKPVDTNPNWRNIFVRGRDDGDRTPALYYFPSSTRIHFRHKSTISWNDGLDPNYILPVNKYTHVAFVVNKNTIKAYINGILESSYTSKGQFIWGTQNNKIAFKVYENISRGNLIKKFLWFNVAATLDDVKNIMNYA